MLSENSLRTNAKMCDDYGKKLALCVTVKTNSSIMAAGASLPAALPRCVVADMSIRRKYHVCYNGNMSELAVN